MNKIIVIVVVMFFSLQAYSDRYEASDDNLLKVQVSELGPTRIAFENKKINDVFFYPEEAAVVDLYPSGVLFVMPNKNQKHVYITIMTDEGNAQDLRLKFAFMQPKPITLFDR